MYTLSVSNVIYHQFSHGTAFFTFNGKNVNDILEFMFGQSMKTVFSFRYYCDMLWWNWSLLRIGSLYICILLCKKNLEKVRLSQ